MPVPWMPIVTTSRNACVCSCAPQRTSPKIDAPDAGAVHTVAARTHRAVHARAGGDVRCSVLGVLLGARVVRDDAEKQYEPEQAANQMLRSGQRDSPVEAINMNRSNQ